MSSQGAAAMQSSTPPKMIGMPFAPPVISQSLSSGDHIKAISNNDVNSIPRPMTSSTEVIYDTRQGNRVRIPPPVTSGFIIKDTGNCSPRLMRSTLNQILCSGDLLAKSGMTLALMVQPLTLPHPSEEPIQAVDLGENGLVPCSRCKAYINHFMKFIDQGRWFICNLCGFSNATPPDYLCHLGPYSRQYDGDERLELCRGTVEFVAPKEFMVREPAPPVLFFLVDVSWTAVQTGATAAACSAINQAIKDLPDESYESNHD